MFICIGYIATSKLLLTFILCMDNEPLAIQDLWTSEVQLWWVCDDAYFATPWHLLQVHNDHGSLKTVAKSQLQTSRLTWASLGNEITEFARHLSILWIQIAFIANGSKETGKFLGTLDMCHCDYLVTLRFTVRNTTPP